MNKLKAIIVDDELDSITALKWELEEFSDKIEIIDSFQNPQEAISSIKANRPDVLFLDIQMPEMDGLTGNRFGLKKRSHSILYL